MVASQPSRWVVLAPMIDATVDIDGSRCAITLEPAAIAKAADAMAGHGWRVTRSGRKRMETFNPVSLQSGHPQATALHGLIHYIDACVAASAQVAALLGLDDLILRTAATLIDPDLLTEDPTDLFRHRERSGRDAFDALIDYIRANLDQPLRLSDLEARSHYSRRALQYAFKERLGCSPKQWIREQRLAVALEQLQADGERPTIKSVALACGYLHPTHFANDFKRRYRMTPNQARRQ